MGQSMNTDTSEQAFPFVLKQFRTDYGLTQQQLANWLEISRSTLKSWEKGDPKRQPHVLTKEGVKGRFLLWLELDEVGRKLQSSPVANSPGQS